MQQPLSRGSLRVRRCPGTLRAADFRLWYAMHSAPHRATIRCVPFRK